MESYGQRRLQRVAEQTDLRLSSILSRLLLGIVFFVVSSFRALSTYPADVLLLPAGVSRVFYAVDQTTVILATLVVT